MKEVKKITTGFVIQKWDAETGKFLGQEFVAVDEVNYEDEIGNPIDVDEIPDFFDKYPYRCFDMVQEPEEGWTIY